MALKLELETLEGLADGVKALYTEKNGKFVLDVDGLDDIAGLKRKRDELLGETKAERAKRTALEDQMRERDEAEAIKNKELEKLAETYKGQASKTAEELATLKRKVADSARETEAAKIAGLLTKDPVRAKLLMKEALASLEYGDDGVKIADGRTAEQLAASLKQAYPFLADGNPASGGGANGGGSNGSGAAKKFNEYSGQELAEIRRTEPAQYERLKSDYHASKG